MASSSSSSSSSSSASSSSTSLRFGAERERGDRASANNTGRSHYACAASVGGSTEWCNLIACCYCCGGGTRGSREPAACLDAAGASGLHRSRARVHPRRRCQALRWARVAGSVGWHAAERSLYIANDKTARYIHRLMQPATKPNGSRLR